MCGVFGISNAENAARLTYLGLFALQHRGQESAGMCTLEDERLLAHRGHGLVSEVFTEDILQRLPGNSSIGHVRYSTAGGNLEANYQPLVARIGGLPVSLAHNGNIVNADGLREQLEQNGAIFQGTADTEIVLHLMARSHAKNSLDKLKAAMHQLVGAYSMLLLTPTHLYAVVDPCAYRPLVLGRLPQSDEKSLVPGVASWVLSSETCALDLVGAEFVRDLAPGEILAIELATGSLQSSFLELTKEQSIDLRQARCSFEQIYFARPDSLLWGATSGEIRQKIGETLAKESPVEADMVIAVPDSGVPMALGYADASNIPFKVGFIRNHYVGRTFIEPTQNVRNFRVRLKLNPVRSTVQGKRVIVVDDSIVRGTTSKKIIELLREAGAKEVHVRIGSPEVRFPCYYGIDTPKRKELLAQRMTLEEMRDYLRADSLAFLSETQLLNVLEENYAETHRIRVLEKPKSHFCTACFSGCYQDNVAQCQGNPKVSDGGRA
jgi:amidophosphoribosyltransferase